jgi:protoporphyrinogen oxidase
VHRVPLRRGILVDGRCYAYPLQRAELARRAPKGIVLRGATEYAAHYLANRSFISARSAKEYMIGRFGKTLSERFFRSYVEKLYGTPWNEIDPEFARALTTSTARTPARATFPYPSRGTGAIGEGIVDRIVAAGGQIRTSSPAQRIELAGPVTVESNGASEPYDHVVSTLSLPVLVRGIPDVPAPIRAAAERLTARSTVLVYLDINGSQCFPELWRFVYDAQYRMGRVANVARWWPEGSARPAPPDRTVLCAECWCTRDDATWTERDDAIAAVCERELRASGLLPANARVDAHHVRRVAGTHPVPAVDAHASLEAIRRYLAGFPALALVGRHAVTGTSDIADNLQSGAEAAMTVIGALRRL